MLAHSWLNTSACHGSVLKGAPVALSHSLAAWDDSLMNAWERFSFSSSARALTTPGSNPIEESEPGITAAGEQKTETSTTGEVNKFPSEVPPKSTSSSGAPPHQEDEGVELTSSTHDVQDRSFHSEEDLEQDQKRIEGGNRLAKEEEFEEKGIDGASSQTPSGYGEAGYMYCKQGDVLDDRYVLMHQLGSGQSSTVWLAKQIQIEEESTGAHRSSGGGAHVVASPKKLAKTPFDPYVAIKIFRCEEGLDNAMKYEQKLSQYVQRQFDASIEKVQVEAASKNKQEEGSSAAAPPESSPMKKGTKGKKTQGVGSPKKNRSLPAAAAGTTPPTTPPTTINSYLGSARFLDSFICRGDHGDHPCAVFEVLGPPLDELLKMYNYTGIPDPRLLRSLLKSCLEGLQLLDDLHVVHTDLKPENLVLSTPSDDVMQLMGIDPGEYADQLRQKAEKARESFAHDQSGSPLASGTSSSSNVVDLAELEDPEDLKVKILDFGLSYIVPAAIRPRQCTAEEKELLYIGNYQRGITIQTREYRAPEIILGCDFGPKADIWSFGCLAFELLTGAFLFDPKDNPLTDQEEDLMDIEHLREMTGLLGKMPKHLVTDVSSSSSAHGSPKGGSSRTSSSTNLRQASAAAAKGAGTMVGVHTDNFFNQKGELSQFLPRPGEDEGADPDGEWEDYQYASPHAGKPELVEEKILDALGGDEEETREFISFLKACLTWDPALRQSPMQLTKHAWMKREGEVLDRETF